ncbi:hypothetical protein L2E82_13690 [Cichorium intybus]|uniref:Uncharacterized protein n=1 Tax=Cichorium intybus TaxID=13427 RepID=A0ACB9EY92_CICIN|nr:hypothetical protein L2E82_13690 [Cichorium intybus]
MGDRTNNDMENLSLQTKNRFHRDLLQRFMASSTNSRDSRGSDPDEEVELNLGLSLGGRFGVDKSNSSLVRSSSIAAILPVVKDDDVLGGRQGRNGPDGAYSSLIRTASLPLESEEWRKRKELQSLRRLAAKRRRSEKQRNLTKVEKEEHVAAIGRVGSSVGPSLGSGSWDFGVTKPTPTSDGSGGALTPPSLPGSVESQTSSKSEFDSRHLQGIRNEGETSPASVQSGQERSNQDKSSSSRSKMADPAVRPSRPKAENQSNNKGKEIGMNTFDMPCVFTQGDSPSGRRIEGILYKYGKGEEVKIMCVCHGSFLSPAEFVKHAGGTDVVHPLKHIVVNPNSSYL